MTDAKAGLPCSGRLPADSIARCFRNWHLTNDVVEKMQDTPQRDMMNIIFRKLICRNLVKARIRIHPRLTRFLETLDGLLSSDYGCREAPLIEIGPPVAHTRGMLTVRAGTDSW